jgi:uncharacterized protein with LGFP repeats
MLAARTTIACITTMAASVLVAGCQSTEAPSSATPFSGVSTSRIVTPAGQFVLQGEILKKFNDVSGSRGLLGMPISDELTGPNNGRYNKFQSGVIYWTAQTGAHVVRGDIRSAWDDTGGAGGPLGYPTSDETPIADGSRADFQHGSITVIAGQPQISMH